MDMSAEKLREAIGEARDDFILDAAAPVRKTRAPLRWAALAACLCLVIAGTLFVLHRSEPGVTDSGLSAAEPHEELSLREQELPKPEEETIRDQPETEQETVLPATAERETASAPVGVTIPAMELPEPESNVEMDMIGLLVYQGGVYTQAEAYYGEEAEAIEPLLGDYLGEAVGSISEWSKQDEYAKEFASTYSGPVYAVKGYDTGFRLCIRMMGADENDRPQLWLQFLERLNGITLSGGEDLFENRLHLKDRVQSFRSQAHEDWNWNRGGISELSLDSAVWERFLEEIDRAGFQNTWLPEGSFYEDHPYSSIFDTPNQAHLYLTMEDGTVVRLRLIEGGYVGYAGIGWWYFVQIPGEAFDAVYDACGGTHVAW